MLLGGAVGACGSTSNAGPGPSDAAIDEVDARAPADVLCVPSSDAAEPDGPSAIGADSVPPDQLVHALAVVRCNFLGRCSSFAAYVVDECVSALSGGNPWSVGRCSRTAAGYGCFADRLTFPYPGAALIEAVAAGDVGYDPAQMAVCLRALQAQDCHELGPWENIPACIRAFSCSADSGAPMEAVDGSASDAGATCTLATALVPCSTPSDCPEAGAASGPYCVQGYCAPTPCGFSETPCQFVGEGQPCDSDPPFLGATTFSTPWGTDPIAVCAPALTCKGLTDSTALGTCARPADVGESCVEGAKNSGCAFGLVCQCGACRMPPSQGPCVDDACKVGVAYCDFTSGDCLRVGALGGGCRAGPQACAPSLTCDSSTATCIAGT